MKRGSFLNGKKMLTTICLMFFINCKSDHVKQVYCFENSDIYQMVTVTYVKTGIDFYCEFVDKNNKSNNITIKGIAKKNIGIEIDEDDEGLAYPAEEYLFSENKITVNFRIALKNKKKMKVITTNDIFSNKGILLLK